MAWRKKGGHVLSLDSTVKAVLYDVRNKAAIKKLRELELEGTYVSSRKVGPALYLVANRKVDFRILKEEVEKPTPSYRDTAQQEEFIALGYDEIRYFPDCPQPNYLLIAGLNLDKPQEKRPSPPTWGPARPSMPQRKTSTWR